MGEEIRLWDGPAPGSESWRHEQATVDSIPDAPGAVRNVDVATLAAYVPGEASYRAVIVLPGGAFHLLSMQNEGHDVARYLVGHGLAAYVLKYRVVPTPSDDDGFRRALAEAFIGGMEYAAASTLPLSVADGERAIELVRSEGYADVTVVGFSAGGRIAAEIVTASRPERRPDAAGIIYTSPVRDVPPPVDAPPLFIAAAADDAIVGIDGSLQLHQMWQQRGRPVELHVFERGGHGFGMRRQRLPVDRWAELFVTWLHSQPD